MGHTVIGIFENSSDAYKAVEKLTHSGFSRSDIDISEHDNNDRVTTDATNEEEDGISKFFNNLFGNNDESKKYSEVSRRSSSLVTVHAQSHEEAHRATSILDDNGAIDVDERAAQYGYNTDYSSDAHNITQDRDKSSTIPIIEEEMQVGKREVVTGGARIRSRIVEKPVEETLRLRQEKVNIERNPADRPASEKDMKHFKEGEIDATERAEESVVNKEARVVEEVKINKEVEEREETVRENVRKTEVDIDHQNKDVRNRDISDDNYSDRDKGV
jgi:stress response protein YsnF